MAWVMLGLAGLAEICWVIGMKYSEGFTRQWWSTFTVIMLAVSMWLLSEAIKTLPVGTAYAIWTGIGAVGAAILGIFLFAESANAVRLGCIGLIVAGIVGLKLSTPG